ncbi:acetyltransferase [Clostridium estertheticum]|uniref:acetyltransferase n=1 Tax=Clostridium estertheticum TaxID=238834 RepID=UPI001CF5D6DF|nr:acetyltransferase [Clostridium estertheticum]MCB2361132.1 acetyltransferase [Clostridium estertheticum]
MKIRSAKAIEKVDVKFEECCLSLIDNSKEQNVRDRLVPLTTYLAIRKSDLRFVGMINIRHKLNE